MIDYIRDGQEIYRNSFAIIRAEANLDRIPADLEKLAVRVIHACGMVEAIDGLQFSEGAGFTKAQAKRRILELAKLLPATARKLQSDPGHRFAGNAVVEQINTLIEQRCALTIRRLTDPAADNDAAAEPTV